MAIYLDYAASAPVKPDVIKKMAEVLGQVGNASSIHSHGRAARQTVEEARVQIASRFAIKPEQVIFTSGATEANHLALRVAHNRKIFISSIEHPSVMQAAAERNAQFFPVTRDGVIDLNTLEQMLTDTPRAFISVMAVNNETGIIQPMEKIAEIAKRFDAIVHCDAVQAAGRIPIDFKKIGVDMMSVSAHKMGGPQGVGALLVGKEIPISPIFTGGSQEQRRRAGTENVAGIAGFAVACAQVDADLNSMPQWQNWRDTFEQRIYEVTPDAIIFGKDAPRVGNITCLAMPHTRNDTQLMAFDLAGIAVSSGAACSSGKVQASAVLQAMGYDADTALCALRISSGWASQKSDWDMLADAWIALYQRSIKNKAA